MTQLEPTATVWFLFLFSAAFRPGNGSPYCWLRPNLSWPKGTYGLIEPAHTGCPSGLNSDWRTGWRHHDTEDSNSNNEWSSPFSLAGYKGSNNMQWRFCIKVSNRCNNVDHKWPRGKYCILRTGGSCPGGFSHGSVKWDDEDSNNANSHGGHMPDGHYDRNTVIDFCCRKDGATENPITLPTNKPFILLAASNLCQHVKGMHVQRQWFKWDDEDSNNSNHVSGVAPYSAGGRNHRIYFCYYHKR
eukprot:m.2993 g.2993  ORF g.2993 m.2993 type:complete len:244 (+) comp9001_c0_seq1:343-1074(+)